MTWLQRYRIRHYVRNSIWILPVVAIAVAAILIRPLHWLEVEMGWQASYDPDTMRTVLATLAGAMFTFIVFVCSSLLLVVQLASADSAAHHWRLVPPDASRNLLWRCLFSRSRLPFQPWSESPIPFRFLPSRSPRTVPRRAWACSST